MTKFHPVTFFIVAIISLFELSSGLTRVAKHPKHSIRQKRNADSVAANLPTKERYRVGVCKKAHDDLVLYNMTYGECITECRSRYLCTAVNLYVKLGVCRLNFHTNQPEELCPKYIFSEKQTWKKKLKPGCESLACKINHRCVNVDGRHTCKPSECPNIVSIPNGIVYGGGVEFGKSRGFKCDQGFRMIGSPKVTCLTSGYWSEDIPTCADMTPAQDTDQTTQSSTLTSTTSQEYEDISSTTISHWNISTYNQTQMHHPAGSTSIYSMTCDDAHPCIGNDLECRFDHCFCVFGTVYDPVSNACVTYCYKRGTTFQVYENVSVSWPYNQIETITSYSCQEVCLDGDCYFMTEYIDDGYIKCKLYFDRLPIDVDKRNTTYATTYVRDCEDTDQTTQSSTETTSTAQENGDLSSTSAGYNLTSNSTSIHHPAGITSNYSMPCDDSLPCDGGNLECRNNHCFCVFGTVHDPVSNTCVTHCYKRGTTFQEYEHTGVSWPFNFFHTIKKFANDSCKEWCLDQDCYYATALYYEDMVNCNVNNERLPMAEEKLNSTNETTYLRDCSEESPECAEKWISGPSQCYRFFNYRWTFNNAKSNCEGYGGKLAELTNEVEDEFIKSQIANISGTLDSVWWIGLFFDGKHWNWSNSGDAVIYHNWAAGHPILPLSLNSDELADADADEYDRCGAYDQNLSGWISEICNRVIFSICEMGPLEMTKYG